LIGGSADLDPSTHTALKAMGDFENPSDEAGNLQGSAGGGWSYAGRNLHFGVREHAMGSIANGLAVHGGIIPFTATFLIFSDYMRPAIRLAALMEQAGDIRFHPRQHRAWAKTARRISRSSSSPRSGRFRTWSSSARAMRTRRPMAWRVAIETRNQPVALVLTRQDVPTLDRARFAGPRACAVAPMFWRMLLVENRIILIGTGSEVSLIVAAGQKLAEEKIKVRIVSMPSWELFDAQPRRYRESVLPPSAGAPRR
jgi:transketolase